MIQRSTSFRLAVVCTLIMAVFPTSLEVAKADTSGPSTAAGDLTELSLEQLMNVPIVVAAGKRQQTERQVAASVSTVTSEDINLFGYRNLGDILRAQRSFYTFNDGLNTFAGVRGFLRPGEWNARVLLLVDGRSTRELIYGLTSLDQEFVVPVESIKRVEIIRGPGSALYGGNAVFGVINVVTKDGADVQGGELHVQGGTHGTARVSALYGLRTSDGWDFFGNFAGYSSRGDSDIKYDGIDDPALNFGHIVDSDYEGAYAIFLKAKKGDFTATFDLENRQRENRAARYFASFFNPGVAYERRANVGLQFDREIAKGRRLHAEAHLGYYGYEEDDHYDADPAGESPAYTYTSSAYDAWLGQEIHYDWQVNRVFHLLIGADATQSLAARQKDYDNVGGPTYVQRNSYNSAAIFAEGEYNVTEWLTLIAGARLDHVQNIGLQFSPRAAAIVKPTKWDAIKLLYGRAFRAPNLYEQFYSPGDYIGNPDLKAEIVDTYEIAWEHQFRSGWQTSLGGFYWVMHDSLAETVLEDGGIQTQNHGRMSARGIEAEIQRRWDTGARFRLHGAATRVEDHSGGIVAHSPEWIVGTSIAIPIVNEKNMLALETQFVGAQESPAGNSTDHSYITNIVFTSRDFARVKGLEFQAGVYNLFANDSRQPSAGDTTFFQPTLNHPPTQLLAGFTYRF